jgi:hypothetical protein
MPTIITRKRREGEEPDLDFPNRTFVEELTSRDGNALTSPAAYDAGVRRARKLEAETGTPHFCHQIP